MKTKGFINFSIEEEKETQCVNINGFINLPIIEEKETQCVICKFPIHYKKFKFFPNNKLYDEENIIKNLELNKLIKVKCARCNNLNELKLWLLNY